MTYNIAHRGYSAKFPENTMLAFKEAIKAPCHGIELDLQLTKDGHVVIFHDEELGRTVDGEGFLKDYTLSELKEFDAGYLFKDLYGFQQIPTLEEYFDLVKNLSIFSVIELKNKKLPYEGLEEKVIDMIKAYDLSHRVILCSFNPVSIIKCQVLAPEIKTALLKDRLFAPSYQKAKSLNTTFLSIRHYFLSTIWITRLRKLKIPIMAWTVNSPSRLKRLIRAKIYGIITDNPQLLNDILTLYKSKA